LYNRENVTEKGIEYKEFVADILYMGFWRSFRNIDGSPVEKYDDGKAEFFRLVSDDMYKSMEQKSYDNRLGLKEPLVYYSTSPEYLPYDVWDNWYQK
jgi:hypothetical protein